MSIYDIYSYNDTRNTYYREVIRTLINQLPAKKKLLPRPCPKCGRENGGVRFIISNPEYRRWKGEYPVYPLLSITHYSPEQRKLKKKSKKNTAKICHYFPVKGLNIKIRSESIRAEDIFNHPNNDYKESIRLQFGQGYFDRVKKHGWFSIIDKKGHWMKGLKLCARCDEPFKPNELKIYEYDNEYYKKEYGEIYANIRRYLCKDCYPKERETAALEIERDQKRRQELDLQLLNSSSS